MKEIDLRNRSKSKNPSAWWVDYLAWHASTPRNWIECKLEPPITDDLSLWWLIMCLDGAPERMRHATETCGQSLTFAHNELAPAEDCFRSLIAAKLDELSPKPAVSVLGDWRDGMIIGYETCWSAIHLAEHVVDACVALNAAFHLPWTHQFHVRAGIGPTLRQAFGELLGTRRDQLSCICSR